MLKSKNLKPALLIFLMMSAAQVSFSQDTLLLPDNTSLYGKVSSLSKGVLKIETSYSENDFEVEWLEIKEIHTNTRFLIGLTGNVRLTGTLRTTGAGTIIIRSDEEGDRVTSLEEVVYLQSLDNSFWSRLSAGVDVGLNFTKANNLRQFNARSNVSYRGDRWSISGKYDGLNSSQDSTESIKRRDYGATFQYFPKKKWYIYANMNWFSNTEQAIELRYSAKIGAGRNLIQNNRATWGFLLGLQPLNEQFSDGTTPDNQSTELFLGSEWNLFDTGDLSFLGSIFAYPSLTEEDDITGERRFRTDFTFDIKYNLPYDLYIKTGLTLNYDNEAVAGNDTDYVWNLGFGWEL